jgi:hypothetical protein
MKKIDAFHMKSDITISISISFIEKKGEIALMEMKIVWFIKHLHLLVSLFFNWRKLS